MPFCLAEGLESKNLHIIRKNLGTSTLNPKTNMHHLGCREGLGHIGWWCKMSPIKGSINPFP